MLSGWFGPKDQGKVKDDKGSNYSDFNLYILDATAWKIKRKELLKDLIDKDSNTFEADSYYLVKIGDKWKLYYVDGVKSSSKPSKNTRPLLLPLDKILKVVQDPIVEGHVPTEEDEKKRAVVSANNAAKTNIDAAIEHNNFENITQDTMSTIRNAIRADRNRPANRKKIDHRIVKTGVKADDSGANEAGDFNSFNETRVGYKIQLVEDNYFDSHTDNDIKPNILYVYRRTAGEGRYELAFKARNQKNYRHITAGTFQSEQPNSFNYIAPENGSINIAGILNEIQTQITNPNVDNLELSEAAQNKIYDAVKKQGFHRFDPNQVGPSSFDKQDPKFQKNISEVLGGQTLSHWLDRVMSYKHFGPTGLVAYTDFALLPPDEDRKGGKQVYVRSNQVEQPMDLYLHLAFALRGEGLEEARDLVGSDWRDIPTKRPTYIDFSLPSYFEKILQINPKGNYTQLANHFGVNLFGNNRDVHAANFLITSSGTNSGYIVYWDKGKTRFIPDKIMVKGIDYGAMYSNSRYKGKFAHLISTGKIKNLIDAIAAGPSSYGPPHYIRTYPEEIRDNPHFYQTILISSFNTYQEVDDLIKSQIDGMVATYTKGVTPGTPQQEEVRQTLLAWAKRLGAMDSKITARTNLKVNGVDTDVPVRITPRDSIPLIQEKLKIFLGIMQKARQNHAKLLAVQYLYEKVIERRKNAHAMDPRQLIATNPEFKLLLAKMGEDLAMQNPPQTWESIPLEDLEDRLMKQISRMREFVERYDGFQQLNQIKKFPSEYNKLFCINTELVLPQPVFNLVKAKPNNLNQDEHYLYKKDGKIYYTANINYNNRIHHVCRVLKEEDFRRDPRTAPIKSEKHPETNRDFYAQIKQALDTDNANILTTECKNALLMVVSRPTKVEGMYSLAIHTQKPLRNNIKEKKLHLYLDGEDLFYAVKNSEGTIFRKKIERTDFHKGEDYDNIRAALQQNETELSDDLEKSLFDVTAQEGFARLWTYKKFLQVELTKLNTSLKEADKLDQGIEGPTETHTFIKELNNILRKRLSKNKHYTDAEVEAAPDRPDVTDATFTEKDNNVLCDVHESITRATRLVEKFNECVKQFEKFKGEGPIDRNGVQIDEKQQEAAREKALKSFAAEVEKFSKTPLSLGQRVKKAAWSLVFDLSYVVMCAGIGAGVGTAVPVIGTGIGAAIGAAVGITTLALGVHKKVGGWISKATETQVQAKTVDLGTELLKAAKDKANIRPWYHFWKPALPAKVARPASAEQQQQEQEQARNSSASNAQRPGSNGTGTSPPVVRPDSNDEGEFNLVPDRPNNDVDHDAGRISPSMRRNDTGNQS